jgi:hypothetical protein
VTEAATTTNAKPTSRRDYTAAIYGSVLAASVIVSSGDGRGPVMLALLLLGSGLVFWLAHVYAETAASVHGGWQPGAIAKGMRHEWPLVFAAVPPAIAVVVTAAIPKISIADGVWVALIVAIIEQQAWGLAAAHRNRLTGWPLTKTVLLNLFIGFLIVALKHSLPSH